MTDTVFETRRTPGIVIFTAVLNFITTAFFAFLSLICLAVIAFGNVMGLYDKVSQEVERYASTAQMGVTFIFAVSMAICLAFAVYFLLIGIGLLKGKKLAWYFQVAMSVVGLLTFPFGTVLNAVILVLFFQQPIREYFKV